MAAAKGAVVALLKQAYQQRNEVGLIAFRGSSAELVLPPTNRLDLASLRLRELPTGGLTPLAAALRLALATLGRWSKARGAATSKLLVLVSDGRANVTARGPGAIRRCARGRAHPVRLRRAALVVDSEDGPSGWGWRAACARH